MKILVVEDEKKIAKSIKKGLQLESLVVDLAFDGEAGLDLASTGNYDVVVLDLMLPKLDGVEVCKRLRAASISTPVLMLTARGKVAERVNGLNAGADDYLTKPFAFSELVARIRALSRRPPDRLDVILKVGNLSLDSVNVRVERASEVIQLSRKEFALLEYLMRNKGVVLSKDQIIEDVWDFASDILPNTVEVYIGYLRNKIDRAFPDEPPLIHTIRGFGYRIGDDGYV